MVEVSTSSFRTYTDVVVIKNLLFKNVNRQQDAHELLIHLLTAMKEADIKHLDKQKPSFMQEIFEGTYRQQVVCTNAECGTVSDSIQPFMDLPLERSPQISLSVLKLFFPKRLFQKMINIVTSSISLISSAY